jgi:cytochrome c556
MHRFVSLTMVIAVTWALSTALVAQKTFTAEDLDRLMKKDGPALSALVRALTGGNQAAAQTQVALLKSALSESQIFWVSHKRPDAIEFGKTVMAKLDDVDKIVSRPEMDTNVALGAVRNLTTSCNNCHKIYRTMDDDGRYILKPGSVPGL